ncbi:cupredoxin domain-containing protein [Aureisphaera galaxeae]|uniref:cupredoxin domain-containing protein n=1 Tax=Aureisphaera galaxeae TaxID=1538023 RepID=UPI0023508CA9|nr:cupredoxin domain-containing protein [Aureisphaera galaxeae]MDC8005430.1 cupredoxin domain-containing protein [Aureisphaera galaxeae]
MKKVIALVVLVFAFSATTFAQDKMSKEVKTVSLEQTPGEFTQKGITLSAGTYVFEIANKQAGTDVGFVLVPQGKDASKPENHIKEAYVTQVVKEGEIQTSNEVTLAKGTYTYFCPLNKTPQYTLTVK